MFYVRINKVKIFNNREEFLWLFNMQAEIRIYSYLYPSHSQHGSDKLTGGKSSIVLRQILITAKSISLEMLHMGVYELADD
jgi:hypothetical protein